MKRHGISYKNHAVPFTFVQNKSSDYLVCMLTVLQEQRREKEMPAKLTTICRETRDCLLPILGIKKAYRMAYNYRKRRESISAAVHHRVPCHKPNKCFPVETVN